MHDVGPRRKQFADMEGTPPQGHHLPDALQLDKRRQTFSGESGTETAQAPFEVISCPGSGQVVAMGGVAKKIT